MSGRGVNRRHSKGPVKAEPPKQQEKKPQLKVHADGSMAGRIARPEGGQVKVGGLTLPVPADGAVVNHRLSDNQLLVVRGEGNTLSVSTRTLGLEVNEEKGKLKGLVAPREVDGKKVVDLGPLGAMPAPAPGGTDSYLIAPDKLLVLKNKDDGTVEVYTRTLGIEGDKKGNFRGDVLPVDGRVEFAGHQLDVGHLKPGEERSEKIKIKGKKYKVKLRMNADGSVTVSGERKKGFLSQVLGFVGKIAPFLAGIPGLGLVAVAAKVVSGFNAVKNFVQSLKSGNLLGMVSSAAGAFVGFSQGAAQAIASKVANLANVGQQVIQIFKHGLGKGLLQVVSNGANLLSGIAGAVGNLGQGNTQRGAFNVARVAGDVARYTHAAGEAFKGNLLPGLGLVAVEVGSNIKQSPNEEGPRYTIRKDIKLTPFDSSQLPGQPLDPRTAPAPRGDGLHYAMRGILEAFPERPDMVVSVPVLVADRKTVYPPTKLILPPDENSPDLDYDFVPVDLPRGTVSVTAEQARELLAKDYNVPVELIEAFGIYANQDSIPVDTKPYGVYLPFAQTKEFNSLMAHLSVFKDNVPKAIDALRSGKTGIWLDGGMSVDGSRASVKPTQNAGQPTSQANFAVHNDPNKPRFEQGKSDNWFTSAWRAAGQFMDGVINGRPGAAGGMYVDLNNVTDLQIAAAHAMSGAQHQGAKLREMANLFVPFASTVTDGASAVNLALNPHKQKFIGRTAGEAGNAAVLGALLELIPMAPGVVGRGPKPKVDIPQSGVRPDLPGTPGRSTDLSAFDKLDNGPVDSWNDPNKNFGTGRHNDAVREGVHCGGFVCAWTDRYKETPLSAFTGNPTVPTGSVSADQIENWLGANGYLRAPRRTFSNSTDAINHMQRRGGDFIVVKDGRNPGDSGHAFVVTVVNGAYKVVDPAGGYADFIMDHPRLSAKTGVIPIIRRAR